MQDLLLWKLRCGCGPCLRSVLQALGNSQVNLLQEDLLRNLADILGRSRILNPNTGTSLAMQVRDESISLESLQKPPLFLGKLLKMSDVSYRNASYGISKEEGIDMSSVLALSASPLHYWGGLEPM